MLDKNVGFRNRECWLQLKWKRLFEWKLHEMEKDYNAKLKYSKEKIDEQIKEACRGILREKDDEISKLQIKVVV